jgi:hypothetical protein
VSCPLFPLHSRPVPAPPGHARRSVLNLHQVERAPRYTHTVRRLAPTLATKQMLCSSGVVKEGSGCSRLCAFTLAGRLSERRTGRPGRLLFLDYPPRYLRDGLVSRLRAKLLAVGRRPNFVTGNRSRRASGFARSRSVSDNAFGVAAADLPIQ